MKRSALLAAAFAVLAAGTQAADENTPMSQRCAPRDDMIAALADLYDETLRLQAMSARGYLIELFVSPSGTWTLVASAPRGLSCPLDSGKGVLDIDAMQGNPAATPPTHHPPRSGSFSTPGAQRVAGRLDSLLVRGRWNYGICLHLC